MITLRNAGTFKVFGLEFTMKTARFISAEARDTAAISQSKIALQARIRDAWKGLSNPTKEQKVAVAVKLTDGWIFGTDSVEVIELHAAGLAEEVKIGIEDDMARASKAVVWV